MSACGFCRDLCPRATECICGVSLVELVVKILKAVDRATEKRWPDAAEPPKKRKGNRYVDAKVKGKAMRDAKRAAR